MSTSLEMKDVQKSYGPLKVVRDFNLHVQPGEFVTFLGPSGSGKTTALKMIAGFEAPTSGDIFLGARSVVDLPPHERGIGMVFQNYALFPHMTVEENVAFPLTVRKVSKPETEQHVLRALQLVRMESYRGRYPNQLSGGQQQRIALARAICFSPSILLMDEPLGALDRNLREHMKIEIMRIQKELNITVVFVTHDQDEALTMSDRVAVINDGELVQVADSQTLYNRPANRFVASFVGESNLFPCRLEWTSGQEAMVAIPNLGLFPASAATKMQEGDSWLFIRPEHIDIAAPGTQREEMVSLDGTVERALFLGEMTRYLVRCGDIPVTVKRQNDRQRPFEPGQAVALLWDREASIILS